MAYKLKFGNHSKLLICILFSVILIPTKVLCGQPVDSSLTTGPDNGSLLIMGGGPMNAELWNVFKELIGGEDKKLVLIPTALFDAEFDEKYGEESIKNFKQTFINNGFSNISVLHTRSKEEANSEAFTRVLDSADGVWFSGGRQWRFADSYLNTKTQDALNKVLERGGVIAGGSAGATIQGSYLARGDTKTNTILMGDHEEGMGFIKNVAIDQHVLTRNRQNDMFEILDHRPELLGIGLDESTGIVVKKNTFTVVGKSYVAIYDGTRWSEERDTIYKLEAGSREYYWLKAGDEYDLIKRKVILKKDRKFITIPKAEKKKYIGNYKVKEDSAYIEITIKKNTLTAIFQWDKSTHSLFPVSETKFFIDNSKFYLDFEIEKNGEVSRFYDPILQNLWIRVKESN